MILILPTDIFAQEKGAVLEAKIQKKIIFTKKNSFCVVQNKLKKKNDNLFQSKNFFFKESKLTTL